MQIRLLTTDDLMLLSRFRVRSMRENGRDGDVIFSPQETADPMTEDDIKRECEAMRLPVTEVGWRRTWILTDEKEIYGEVVLVHRPPLKASLHRCILMIGIERVARGQGWGGKLMREALAWARQQPSLDWVSLYVFAPNKVARALYEKLGFTASGTTEDLFRVFGQSIDDIQMDLRLR